MSVFSLSIAIAGGWEGGGRVDTEVRDTLHDVIIQGA